MEEITAVRYSLISRTVLNCLEIMGINTYPVNPRKLAGSIYEVSGRSVPLIIDTYSGFAAYKNMDVAQVIFNYFKSSEGATVYFSGDNLHAIFYNDLVTVPGRINWTVAHELGHVLLEHYKYMNPIIMGRKSFSGDIYAILEKEADCFARYLLCHPLVLIRCGYKFTQNELARLCHISNEAAKNALAGLQSRKKPETKWTPWDLKIAERFVRFTNTRKCKDCGKIFTSSQPVFCPVCRSTRILWYNGPESQFQKSFGSPKAETHAETSTGGDINKCILNTCPDTLASDYRYCPVCGHESLYYSRGLLDDWL